MLNIPLLLLAFNFAACYSQDYDSYRDRGYNFKNHEYCDDLSPYFGEINLEQIAGVWYGVEKIVHTRGVYRIEHTERCFYIDIKELHIQPTPPTPYPPYPHTEMQTKYYNTYGYQEPYRVRNFVLEWHQEGSMQMDYHVKVNTSHKGFWMSDVPSTAVENQYRYFGGVIQVLKVSNNHLVLNFCTRMPTAEFYSVVLSRFENQLNYDDLASIHQLFTKKNLPTSALQRVCSNSAAEVTASALFAVTALISWLRYA